LSREALEVEPAQRAAFLDKACAGHDSLRREVETLLQSHDESNSFLEQPVVEDAAEMLVNDQPQFSAGQRIGHYEIIKLIGEGGMGEVYLAEDKSLGRKVALKFLPAYFTKNDERLRRFEQEARAASALNHPNILTIHEIGEADGRRFIATELIDGETLRQRIVRSVAEARAPEPSEEMSQRKATRRDREELKLGEVLSIAEQTTSALAAAHAAGIIHRDIKPENIMLRRDALVKVLDFGLAKLTETKEAGPDDSTRALIKTSAGVVIGTVAYMSPEQARGLPVDARSDIWSLGVVLYEAVAGHRPFAGETNSDVLVSILEREPRSLTSFSAEIPEALEWIITKALTKDRDDRYQTARELLTDLRRLKGRLDLATALERSVVPELSKEAFGGRVTAASLNPTRMVSTPGRSKSQARLVRMLPFAAVIILLAGVIMWKGGALWVRRSAPIGTPVVVLMDSPLPDRVYDPETRKNGGTNADDITDILRDLPISIQKENTSPLWHREDQVLRQNPTLIIMHRSCFADAGLGFDPQSNAAQLADSRLGAFLGYISLGNPTTKFLIYTRRSGDQMPWALDLEKRFPRLKDRIVTMSVPGGPEHATFRDSNTGKMLKQQVQSILGLR
jgi:serine/threonine protein kinase